MNVSYKWLKEYVDFDLTPQETADALTSCGLEVDALEEVQSVKGGLKGLYVGKVLTCEEHPNSDHLHVTTVDLGKGEPQQIVCGAPNVAAGQKVIVADLGCVLYDGDQSFTIKKSKLRGVESLGMICAEDEIGVGTSHDGIIVLPEDAPVGQPAAEYYHLESDWFIEIDITANRADALGHWGVARDLYAWLKQNGYKTSLHRPSCDEFVVDNEDLPIDVEIQNTEACKRYACVSITGCEVKESPKWLQDKLNIIGLRPINNIVDITNYIMMAYGQPLHCFDADMVTGHKIVVRTQPEGTKFVTLDGEEHTLGEHDLSICNAEEPMCIAGIFGGKGSGTYETTKSVVLESAYFHPTWIRKSARRHGLSTDASYRFERGVDTIRDHDALNRAAHLLEEMGACETFSGIVEAYPEELKPAVITTTAAKINGRIGVNIAEEEMVAILTKLGFGVEAKDGELLITAPTWRRDIDCDADISEEIARMHGYDFIESHQPELTITQGSQSVLDDVKDDVQDYMVGAGLSEMMTYSFIKANAYDKMLLAADDARRNCIELLNPITDAFSVMRTTMVPSALQTASFNLRNHNNSVALFEIGRIFLPKALPLTEDPEERQLLTAVLSGSRKALNWCDDKGNVDFYDMKGIVEGLLEAMQVSDYTMTRSQQPYLHPGKSCDIVVNGEVIGSFGEVHPVVQENFELDQVTYVLEMAVEPLVASATAVPQYKHLPKFPSMSRDIAVVVPVEVTNSELEGVIREHAGELLRGVRVFDIYTGKQVAAGCKSMAFNLTYQAADRTLTDAEVDASMKKVIAEVAEAYKAKLRD